mmetsp:Transcript_75941/g.173895  ORF Transcript_75941/g.173895 Transcript_75941/m.173895 type:complete len:242 (-) Transcript_75941:3136-3861(-)
MQIVQLHINSWVCHSPFVVRAGFFATWQHSFGAAVSQVRVFCIFATKAQSWVFDLRPRFPAPRQLIVRAVQWPCGELIVNPLCCACFSVVFGAVGCDRQFLVRSLLRKTGQLLFSVRPRTQRQLLWSFRAGFSGVGQQPCSPRKGNPGDGAVCHWRHSFCLSAQPVGSRFSGVGQLSGRARWRQDRIEYLVDGSRKNWQRFSFGCSGRYPAGFGTRSAWQRQVGIWSVYPWVRNLCKCVGA